MSLELRELVLSRHHDGLSDGNLLGVELLESVNADEKACKRQRKEQGCKLVTGNFSTGLNDY